MQKESQLANRAAAIFVDIDNVRPGFDLDMKALRSFATEKIGCVKRAAAYVRHDSKGRLERLARAAREAGFQVIPTSSNADGRMQFDLARLKAGKYGAILLCSNDGGFADLLGFLAEQYQMTISLLHSGSKEPRKLAKVSRASGGKVLSLQDEGVRRVLCARGSIPI